MQEATTKSFSTFMIDTLQGDCPARNKQVGI